MPHIKNQHVTLKVDGKDLDYHVEEKPDDHMLVTDVDTGKAITFSVKNFDLEYGALLRFDLNGEKKLVQFLTTHDTLYFDFWYKGQNVQMAAYTESQHKVKKYMAVPKKTKSDKHILSPMPG
jgi:hypothetical protein